MRVFSLLFILLTIGFVSCRTQRAVTRNYLQDQSDTTVKDSIPVLHPVIQKNDLLSIRVFSSAAGITPEADAPYNLPDQGTAVGFLVDENGNIDYPQVGTLHVAGLTREQLAALIKSRLANQLDRPAVIVRFLNFRVTILGEVNGPSTFTVPIENITILEALGLAGDITEFGRKDNVKIFREKNGQREIGSIDLTSTAMFNSPYFRLQQNDVVMVEPTPRKIKQQEQQALVQQIGIASSIITAIALILNLIR